ncbi:hypothetical protein QYE76_020504 [Lolium multiflorum]|uniref:Uncharacterized protein n=1 Tax=Lolium multiflorum TaxID=4521 RepID=A0AAD8VPA4_LOLMU|nr:hypothetical protein QYE76_020504 [Lolium multiflorum]
MAPPENPEVSSSGNHCRGVAAAAPLLTALPSQSMYGGLAPPLATAIAGEPDGAVPMQQIVATPICLCSKPGGRWQQLGHAMVATAATMVATPVFDCSKDARPL